MSKDIQRSKVFQVTIFNVIVFFHQVHLCSRADVLMEIKIGWDQIFVQILQM